ncbi:hypothetical protein CR513_62140, partial [Mucuna pruriens]
MHGHVTPWPPPFMTIYFVVYDKSNHGNFHSYDLDIDKTFHRFLRNSKSNEVVNSRSLNCSVLAFDSMSSSFASDSASSSCASDLANNVDSNFDLGSSSAGFDSNFGVSISQFSLENMENNDRTLKELATPDINLGAFDILNWNKLSHFHDLAGEDPHKHFKEFYVMCSTMRSHGIPEDYIKMKVFLFSLDGATKD